MKFPSLISKGLTEEHLLILTQRLLDSIANSDWQTYEEIVHPDATCFEPEAGGSLIAGYPFHKFWFDAASQPPPALPAPASPTQQIEGQTNLTVNTSVVTAPRPVTSICSPHVRMLGESKDVAVLCYTRIVQKFSGGKASATQSAETRVFEKQGSKWRLMHLHRHGIQSAL